MMQWKHIPAAWILPDLPSNQMIDALLGIASLHFCQNRYTQAKIMAGAAKDKAKEISTLKEGQVNLTWALLWVFREILPERKSS